MSRASLQRRVLRAVDDYLTGQWDKTKRYFSEQDPLFWIAFTPALIAAAAIFVRNPNSNYIFDEQEALLANPYVNGKDLGWLDFIHRDFWGLPPDHSIGSYRPIPNLIWRALWQLNHMPWLHHWVNVVFHAANAALVASFTFAVTRRRDVSWLAGAAFVACAVLTEAVTGVVGIADVLGGLGVLLALQALRQPLWAMPLLVFLGVAFGLGSKESGMVAVPLVAWAALVTAPMLHPKRPLGPLRGLLALAAAAAAFVGYVMFRRHNFPVTLPKELQASLPATDPFLRRAMHEFLRWFQQPRLPSDPINNPLIEADTAHRVAGALRVYWSGIKQVVVPWTLSGDYSFPQEPVPDRVVFPGSVLGAAFLALPPVAALGLWLHSLYRLARGRAAQAWAWVPDAAAATSAALLAIGLLWIPVSYFPHSNIPVLLPTVRAERFWYLPVMGTSLVLAVAYAALLRSRLPRNVSIGCVVALLGFQAVRGRVHALDYTDDLTFWRSTSRAVPNSAKAHLNYGVMVGARGKLPDRLVSGKRALDLAPRWPMAHIYYGDTLCRMHRAEEAWPHYARGFELGSNEPNLIALALQCLWDEKALEPHKDELLELADRFPGSWIAYLGRDIVYNGEQHKGVDPQYRPRGYDEGPKKK